MNNSNVTHTSSFCTNGWDICSYPFTNIQIHFNHTAEKTEMMGHHLTEHVGNECFSHCIL